MVVKKYSKEAEEARKEAEMAREEVFKVREKTAKDHAEMESSVTSANRRAEEAEKQRAAAEKSKEQATIERVAAQAYAKKLEISQADTLKNKNAAEKRYEDLVVTNRNIQLCCTNLAKRVAGLELQVAELESVKAGRSRLEKELELKRKDYNDLVLAVQGLLGHHKPAD